MRKRAAEGAASPDRMVADVANHRREQPSQRSGANRLVECGVSYTGANSQLVAIDLDGREFRNPVDVNEVSRLRQPERHDRDEALPARQDAAVLRRDLRQHRDRLGERLRGVIAEGSGLHSVDLSAVLPGARAKGPAGNDAEKLYDVRSNFGTFIIFWIRARS